MIFTELRFLYFFAVAFAVHWSLGSNRARKLWLLLCSYAFYAAWDWRFCSLIVLSTAIDYGVGRALLVEQRPAPRRRWLQLSLISNLGLLGVFKYFNFFVDSATGFLQYLGIPASDVVLRIGLPIGISFYTFQTLSYSIDTYYRRIEPTRNALDFSLFVAFFPQLVAGPIVRARDFLPQLQLDRRFSQVDVRACLTLFLIGFAKKAIVSDGISPYTDQYFADPSAYDAASAWLGLSLYAAQVYCDFSAYSDMAIASAGLLGFNLRVNFDFPYFATNVSEFWRRWHMSLSTWLRDYLYIPLGGSRGSSWQTCRNLMITLVLSGLWHGAAWHFVAFGALHGAALVVHLGFARLLGRRVSIPAALGILATMIWWVLSLAYFRAPDFATGTAALQGAFGSTQGSLYLGDRMVWAVLALYAIHWLSYQKLLTSWWKGLPDWAFAAAYGLASALVLSMIHHEAQPFIYFQF